MTMKKFVCALPIAVFLLASLANCMDMEGEGVVINREKRKKVAYMSDDDIFSDDDNDSGVGLGLSNLKPKVNVNRRIDQSPAVTDDSKNSLQSNPDDKDLNMDTIAPMTRIPLSIDEDVVDNIVPKDKDDIFEYPDRRRQLPAFFKPDDDESSSGNNSSDELDFVDEDTPLLQGFANKMKRSVRCRWRIFLILFTIVTVFLSIILGMSLRVEFVFLLSLPFLAWLIYCLVSNWHRL